MEAKLKCKIGLEAKLKCKIGLEAKLNLVLPGFLKYMISNVQARVWLFEANIK